MTSSSSSSDSEVDTAREEKNDRGSGIKQRTPQHEDSNATSSDYSSSESEKSDSGNPVSGFLDSIGEFTSNITFETSSTSSSVKSLSSFFDNDVKKKDDGCKAKAQEKIRTQINENVHKFETSNVSATLQSRKSSSSNESDAVHQRLSEDRTVDTKQIQVTNDAQKADLSNVSLESKDPDPACLPAEPLFRTLLSEKAGGEIKETKKSESSSTSISDLSDSSSRSDFTEERAEPLITKPPSATVREKHRTPVRPKTAKLPRTRNAREEKTRVITSSSSASSVGSFEKQKKSMGDEFHQQKKLELFLHRCLSEHLASQLDKQRAYFAHGYTAPRLRTRRRTKRSDMTSSNSFRSETHRSMTSQRNTAMILPSFFPRIREEDVRRNIEMLVAELARSENVRSMMWPPDLVRVPQQRFRGRTRANERSKKRSESEVTSSEYASSSSSSSSTNEMAGNLSKESSSNEERYSAKCKSMLKNSRSNRDRAKHVTMVESLSRTNRSPLSSIVTSVGQAHYIMADNYGHPHHVVLRHAPVHSYKRHSRKREHKRKKKKENKRKEEHGSESDNGEKAERSKPQLEEEKIKPGASPRIRPGTEPIKCNWKAEKAKTFEPKFSDHQLKNSSNPAVLEWLAHKNELARRNRIYRFRENRSKRDRLMQEHNEREDKRANALIEYERWKKKKNREVLLRRRREALDANASKIEDNIVDQAENKKQKEPAATTFSDLRSSATTPQSPSIPPHGALVTPGRRRRPKSAPTKVSFGGSTSAPFIPVRIDPKSGDVTIVSPRSCDDAMNLSAREPMIQESGDEKPSFIQELLEEKSPNSMFNIPHPGTIPQSKSKVGSPKDGKSTNYKSPSDKDHYNNWVRSKGASSPYQIRYNKKKITPSPPHDPMTNELLSDLAKRRIKKIMDQKKRVDSGLRKKEEKIVEKSKEEGHTVKKWRLKEEPSVNLNLKRVSRKRERNLTAEERPVFSYNRKTKSKSIFHERNPVLNQALHT